jgi:hypothetical protein
MLENTKTLELQSLARLRDPLYDLQVSCDETLPGCAPFFRSALETLTVLLSDSIAGTGY